MRRLTLKYIKFKTPKLAERYECLAMEYIYSKTKYNNKCDKGHIYETTWNNFKRGRRCLICWNKKRGKTQKLSLKDIKSETQKLSKGYVCKAKEYKNVETKMNFKCSQGHDCWISWDKFKQGRRCYICWSIKRCGENHPAWRGGIACEPYCDIWLDKEYKESIKERDGYVCQNEDCWKTSKRLCVHHINYIKKDCHPKNLITICLSCNSRANKNRRKWEEYYNKKVKGLYNEKENNRKSS